MTATLTYAPPRFRAVPLFSSSTGQDCIDLAEAAGLILDDWQQDIIRDALGSDPSGRWAAMEVALIVPRQNGKGAILEALELYHLFVVKTTRLITHTAHRFDTCLDHFRRFRSLIEKTPELLALVKDNGRGLNGPSGIKDSNGKESIELWDGSRLLFKAREKGSGAGFSGDLVVLDEAWYLRDLSGLVPTMAARENPQAWYTSSAPHPGAESDNLRALIRQGRALATDPDYERPDPEDPTMAYFEWSVEAPGGILPELEDETVIRDGNPAFGIRLNRRFCRVERRRMGDEKYARERLGIFPEEDEAPQWLVIPETAWSKRADNAQAEGWLTGKVSLAVEVTRDSKHASICAAGERTAGGLGVSVALHVDSTVEVVPYVLELWETGTVSHVVIDKAGPAAHLISELEGEGVVVKAAAYADIKVATSVFMDGIEAARLWYRLTDTDLSGAVARATWRPAGDTRIVDRRSGADVSALTGCQLALWGHLQSEEEGYALAVYA